jgi:Transposase DDE domain
VLETPDDKAQRNFTAPELPILRTTNKGWDDCGHAPARVDAACQIILACDVTDATKDQQQAEPLAQATRATRGHARMDEHPKDESGTPQAIPATWENGEYSEAAVRALATAGCDPYLATERQRRHGPQAAAPATPSTAQERMAATVRTPEGKALYASRKVIVAPVCGQIKEARGFRRFLLRGLDTLWGEWRLVCLTQTLLKIWRYGSAHSAAEGRRESTLGA